jgi:hypothetical protein
MRASSNPIDRSKDASAGIDRTLRFLLLPTDVCARHFIFIQWVHHVFRLQVFPFQGWANIYTSRQKKTFCVELRGDFLLREKGELEKREGAVEE